MILTTQEAADALDYAGVEDMPNKVMSVLVPAVSGFIRGATGKDWGADDPVNPVAKMCATVLLVRWFEDAGQIGNVSDRGLLAIVGQLAATAKQESIANG